MNTPETSILNCFKVLSIVGFLGIVSASGSYQKIHGQESAAGKQQNQEKIVDVSSWSEEQQKIEAKHLTRFFDYEGMPPAKYVVSKFKRYDVVLFGEVHEVKENCEFVASLIKPLHESGVRILFSETIPTRFNKEIAMITNAESYDEPAVIEIFRQRPLPTWGYQEYVDIVKAVWEFNRSLRSDQPKFEIIGLEDDYNELAMMRSRPVERFKIVVDREKHMTDIIRQRSLSRAQKALVHIGHAHTVQHGIRVAKELEKTHAGKVFQVVAHQDFSRSKGRGPITKCIESAVKQSKFDAVGFDIENTKFGMVRDSKSYAFKMLGKNTTLKDLARGYVFLKPVSKLNMVSWIEGFVTEDTFKEALEIAKMKRWVTENPESAKQLNQMIADTFRKRNSSAKK